MLEKCLPYNLAFHYIRGEENCVADYGSRKPRSEHDGEEFKIFNPIIQHRSRKVFEKHFDAKDPQVERIADLGAYDTKYIRMISHILNRTPIKQIEKDCELKAIEGSLKELSVFKTTSGKEIILRNCTEIIIPESDRTNMLTILHNTHLESDSMKRLARGKFWWPRMSKDIEEKYKSCQDCKEEGISKMHKRAVVIPADLTMMAPAEELSMDYATFENRKYMIMKDKASGFIDVKATKDQTTAEAQRCVHEWAFTFGLPHEIKTDGGPAFREGFQSYLMGLGIGHTPTSAYNPQSNGLAERGVRQIKDVLKKTKKKPTAQDLREMVFNINNHEQKGDAGSAAKRFFRRGVRTLLPNSIVREIDHRSLIKARHDKQTRIAEEKGRSSKDTFEVGDSVLIQDQLTKRWILKGEISELRIADDGSTQSYQVRMNDGSLFLRNKRFIKHDSGSVTIKKRVHFQLKPTADEVVEKAGPTLRSEAKPVSSQD